MDTLFRITSGLASLIYLWWIVEVIGSWVGAWMPQNPSQGLILGMSLVAFTASFRWTLFPSSP